MKGVIVTGWVGRGPSSEFRHGKSKSGKSDSPNKHPVALNMMGTDYFIAVASSRRVITWDNKGSVEKTKTDTLLEFNSDVTALDMSANVLIAGSAEGHLKVLNLTTFKIMALRHGRQQSRAVGLCLNS